MESTIISDTQKEINHLAKIAESSLDKAVNEIREIFMDVHVSRIFRVEDPQSTEIMRAVEKNWGKFPESLEDALQRPLDVEAAAKDCLKTTIAQEVLSFFNGEISELITGAFRNLIKDTAQDEIDEAMIERTIAFAVENATGNCHIAMGKILGYQSSWLLNVSMEVAKQSATFLHSKFSQDIKDIFKGYKEHWDHLKSRMVQVYLAGIDDHIRETAQQQANKISAPTETRVLTLEHRADELETENEKSRQEMLKLRDQLARSQMENKRLQDEIKLARAALEHDDRAGADKRLLSFASRHILAADMVTPILVEMLVLQVARARLTDKKTAATQFLTSEQTRSLEETKKRKEKLTEIQSHFEEFARGKLSLHSHEDNANAEMKTLLKSICKDVNKANVKEAFELTLKTPKKFLAIMGKMLRSADLSYTIIAAISLLWERGGYLEMNANYVSVLPIHLLILSPDLMTEDERARAEELIKLVTPKDYLIDFLNTDANLTAQEITSISLGHNVNGFSGSLFGSCPT